MPALTNQQRLIVARALVNEARSVWESIDNTVIGDTYMADKLHQFDDAGHALTDMGAIGRTLRAVLKDD